MKKLIIIILLITLVFTSLWVVFSKSSIPNEIDVDKEQEEPIRDDEEVIVNNEKSESDEEIVIDQKIEIIDETDNSTEEPTDEEILIRYDSKNSIDMGVVYSNLIEDDEEYIIFKLRLNNHIIDLEDIKYDELATLTFSNGTIVDDGFIWESNSEGHHISGKLKLPKNYLGTNITIAEIGSVQLEFEGLGGPEKMTFRWEKDVVDLYAK
jgi:hypothetical protein